MIWLNIYLINIYLIKSTKPKHFDLQYLELVSNEVKIN